jgi:hypothetical protein
MRCLRKKIEFGSGKRKKLRGWEVEKGKLKWEVGMRKWEKKEVEKVGS